MSGAALGAVQHDHDHVATGVLSDVPTPSTIAGAAMIAASGIDIAWREHRRGVRQAATPVAAV